MHIVDVLVSLADLVDHIKSLSDVLTSDSHVDFIIAFGLAKPKEKPSNLRN